MSQYTSSILVSEHPALEDKHTADHAAHGCGLNSRQLLGVLDLLEYYCLKCLILFRLTATMPPL